MHNISIQFTYSQDEYVKAFRQYLFASRTMTTVSIIIAGAYFIFTMFYLPLSGFSPLSIAAAAISIIYIVLFWTLYVYVPNFAFKNTVKFQEEYFLSFSDDGISFKTESINSQLKWSIYRQVIETSDFIFLVQNSRMYTIIPKRTFSKSEMLESFRELVTGCIGVIKRIL